ncbi:UvrB/UvrC motif-containing protein [Salinispira pacifica]|uniref:Nucleotide excision repair protein n=1 Tax=Salinispira pacifica TaxID=1307761 RepID=V5WGG5_9SPIO|nr:UvrB/UvrC motif-containing protein [Salinispira pacifica]AHC14256.1 Nucleotide excision repair protein [Salinispira pacifica]
MSNSEDKNSPNPEEAAGTGRDESAASESAGVCEICSSDEHILVLRQMLGKKERTVNICTNCASILGIERPESGIRPQTGDLLTAVLDPGGVGPRDSRVCDSCGISYAEIRRQGLAGCARCYDVFKSEITALLRRVTNRNSHRGKLPRRLWRVKSLLIEKPELELELRRALEQENYELAARLRAAIAELEGEEKPSGRPLSHGAGKAPADENGREDGKAREEGSAAEEGKPRGDEHE